MVLVAPSASKRHNRLARLLANGIVKADQYAKAGIQFYWRVEQAATGAPILYTYVLDPATRRYREGEVFTDVVKLTVPFLFEVVLSQL